MIGGLLEAGCHRGLMERSKFAEFSAAGKAVLSARPVSAATANVRLPHAEPFAAPRLEPPRGANTSEFFDGFAHNVRFMRPKIPSIIPTPDLRPNAGCDKEYEIHFSMDDLVQARRGDYRAQGFLSRGSARSGCGTVGGQQGDPRDYGTNYWTRTPNGLPMTLTRVQSGSLPEGCELLGRSVTAH